MYDKTPYKGNVQNHHCLQGTNDINWLQSQNELLTQSQEMYTNQGNRQSLSQYSQNSDFLNNYRDSQICQQQEILLPNNSLAANIIQNNNVMQQDYTRGPGNSMNFNINFADL